ncbi:MAG: hypothetical protein ACRDVE_10130, partial [Actinocrinis sp.]
MSEEPTTGPAVSEQVERLWEHYQTPRPNPNQWPQELTPMRAYDWNGEILRLELTAQVRAVAFALSWLGNADGGNVMPADPRLAASTGLSRRQLIEHVDVLRDLRLLHRVQRAGGRTGRVCDLYQLCVPADLGTLPFRVDGDFRPLRERTAGEAPVKAIAASKAARAARAAERDARFDVKAASPQTGAPLTHDVKPTSLGTDVAPSFEVKPPSRQS